MRNDLNKTDRMILENVDTFGEYVFAINRSSNIREIESASKLNDLGLISRQYDEDFIICKGV